MKNFLKLLYKYWIKFGEVMGTINGTIILTAIYAILIIPMAILFKIIGKDPLKLKLKKEKQSYLEEGQKIDLNERPF